MAALTVLGTVASLVGTAVAAQGTLAAGKARQQAAEFQAKQLERKAQEEQAAAQQQAMEVKQQKRRVQGKLQAQAAASGFSATDPTALALGDEITRYGTYKQQLTSYGGRSARDALVASAAGKRFEGAAAMKGARYGAMGTILGGISGLTRYAGSYGGGGGGGSYRYG